MPTDKVVWSGEVYPGIKDGLKALRALFASNDYAVLAPAVEKVIGALSKIQAVLGEFNLDYVSYLMGMKEMPDGSMTHDAVKQQNGSSDFYFLPDESGIAIK